MLTVSARLCLTLGFVTTLTTAVGCRQHDTNDPDTAKSGNLCRDYSSCNECIAGQVERGFKKGAAETQCGAAVTGCWATWDKPVVCSSSHVDDPQLEKAKAEAAAEEEAETADVPPQQEPSQEDTTETAETPAIEADTLGGGSADETPAEDAQDLPSTDAGDAGGG